MPAISSKRFNWLPTRSTWQEMEAWRERRRMQRGDFEATAASASNAFAAATQTLSTGMAEIAAKIAAARVAGKIEGKIASINKLA